MSVSNSERAAHCSWNLLLAGIPPCIWDSIICIDILLTKLINFLFVIYIHEENIQEREQLCMSHVGSPCDSIKKKDLSVTSLADSY